MRPLNVVALLLATSLGTAAAITACVGDDAVATTPDVTPGVEGGVPGVEGGPVADGSTGTDSSTGPDGNTGDGATPALDVRTVPGLRLWLESTQNLTKAAAGNDIVSWKDSSGRWADGGAGTPDGGAHTAVPIPFSGGGAVYPSVVANGIAGRPSVGFDSGPKLSIPNHEDFAVGTGDFVVAVVGAISSGQGTLWRLTTATSAPSGVWLSAEKGCSSLTPPKCTSPDYSPNTSPHVFVLRRKAAQEIFRVDGTSRGTLDFGVDNPNLSVSLFPTFASAMIGGGIVGQLSEILVVVGPTADASLDKLEAHLKTKYAIP